MLNWRHVYQSIVVDRIKRFTQVNNTAPVSKPWFIPRRTKSGKATAANSVEWFALNPHWKGLGNLCSLSSNFDATGRTDVGWLLSISVNTPLLKSGVTLVCFHPCGMDPQVFILSALWMSGHALIGHLKQPLLGFRVLSNPELITTRGI